MNAKLRNNETNNSDRFKVSNGRMREKCQLIQIKMIIKQLKTIINVFI